MTDDSGLPADGAEAERAQPETTRFRAVSPLLTVDDVASSATWYAEVLGFHKAGEWHGEDGSLRGAQMKAGDVTFTLVQDDFAKGRDRDKGAGFRLYCTTVQDVDALAERVRVGGGRIDMEPTTMEWGRIFAITDPDGFKISIGNETEAESR